jgi:polyhydroxyalkanoate synthase
MLGIPGPARVAAAAANFYDASVRGGLADLRRMPAALIDHGRLRSLYRYLPVEQAAPRETTGPVLLVPPLAAPAFCFDLRRGCSLAEHLLLAGREAYLVDYGVIEFSDRTLGLEHWFDEVIPEAIRATSADAGDRPVHLVGWSLGGIFALLTHAGDAGLPVASVTMVGTPFDFSRVPMIAPLRPIAAVTRGQGITQLYRALGGAPAPLVRGGYQLLGIDKYVMKPFTIAANLDDRDLLAQIEAVNHFMASMHAYPGRTFGQLYHRFFRTNDLAQGRLALTGRTIDLADVTARLLAVAGLGDGIAPIPACHHVAGLVPNAASVDLETAPGGHLGVLTGRAARGTTWTLLDEHLDR